MSKLPFTLDAIVFDFDGVLAESVSVKGDAFVDLYRDEADEIKKAVRAFHDGHGGVSRWDKFRYYEEELLGRPLSEEGMAELGRRFSEKVEQMVVASDTPAGTIAFLEKFSARLPFFVASATPQEELLRIAQARDVSKHFHRINGTPGSKGDHIRSIIAEFGYQPSRMVMIGDAGSDFKAAQETGTHFVGRRLPGMPSPFPEDTPVIDDLTEFEDILTQIAPNN